MTSQSTPDAGKLLDEASVDGVPIGPARPGKREKILVVDDQPLILLDVGNHLSAAGYEVLGAMRLSDALDCLGKNLDIELVLSDVDFGDNTGITDLLKRTSGRQDLKFIVITGWDDTSEKLKTLPPEMRARVVEIIPKPFIGETIVAAVRQALAASMPSPAAASDRLPGPA